jgi:hypothetical protein
MARVPRAAAAGLASLRGFELQAAEDGAFVWLGGDEASEELVHALHRVDRLELFDVRAGGALARSGERVPRLAAPKLAWRSIAALVQPRFRNPVGDGDRPVAVALQLVRSSEFEPSTSLLVSSLAIWVAWCASAPLVRLERLAFAASADGRVYVRGEPLPPLPGAHFVERDGIALPAGWKLDPAHDRAGLARGLGLAPGDVGLIAHTRWERIGAADFVRASRSAARATLGESASEALRG